MKKLIVILSLIILCFTCKAQEADTTVIRKPIVFESEVVISKTGNQTVKYYAVLDGEYYDSNKTSAERYFLIKRFNGTPCVVLVTTGKTKRKKIIVL